jgi:hypothetical protein
VFSVYGIAKIGVRRGSAKPARLAVKYHPLRYVIALEQELSLRVRSSATEPDR